MSPLNRRSSKVLGAIAGLALVVTAGALFAAFEPGPVGSSGGTGGSEAVVSLTPANGPVGAGRAITGATPSASASTSLKPSRARESIASLLAGAVPWPAPVPQLPQQWTGAQFRGCPPWANFDTEPNPYRGFYLSRGAYSSDPFRGGGNSWAVDFEKADRQMLVVMQRLLNIDLYECENVVYLDDPHMRKFPFVFMVEVGNMGLTQREAEGLRSYILQGGFVMVDDFWGSYEWAVFESEITRVLPEYRIVEMPMDHLIFHIVYPIKEVLQVPSVGNGERGNPAFYYEDDGYVPHVRGIFDDNGRLLVLISWNSDLVDAWEWAERPRYPWDRSNYAFQLGFNVIIYALTH